MSDHAGGRNGARPPPRPGRPLPAPVRPMLAPVRPMLARPGTLPSGGGWALEMKWDGVRALAYVAGGRLRLLSRSGRDVTGAYPELDGLGAALGGRQAVLDGEIVVLGAGRWPDFEALQQRMNIASVAVARRLATTLPVTYLIFDLLHLDGRDLLRQPWLARRKLLESLALDGPHWQTPPAFTGEPGAQVLGLSQRHGLEGVVAKRLESRYEPGQRTGSWIKIKNVRHQEAVVGGWQPGQGGRAGRIGSLLVGVPGVAGLAYAGRVGTGFSDATLGLLGDRLAPLRRATSPFATPVPPADARGAVWVEPALVIEVRFAGWTRAGRLRAPSYRGLRPGKDPADVVRE